MGSISLGSWNQNHRLSEKWVKGIKRYTLPVRKKISDGVVMYSVVTLVNNTVLCICKLLRE